MSAKLTPSTHITEVIATARETPMLYNAFAAKVLNILRPIVERQVAAYVLLADPRQNIAYENLQQKAREIIESGTEPKNYPQRLCNYTVCNNIRIEGAVLETLEANGMDIDKFRSIKGFYNPPSSNTERPGIIHIDALISAAHKYINPEVNATSR